MAHNNIKFNYNTNMFQPLAEEHSEEGKDNDRVRKGSVSNASSSRGSRMSYQVTLTPEILAMMDRHEPDKTKQAKMLTEHLAGHKTLPSTEEELQEHLERKSKREANILLAAPNVESTRQEGAMQAEVTRRAQHANVIATFAKRAKDATIVTWATAEEAETTRHVAAAEVETSFSDSIAMQE